MEWKGWAGLVWHGEEIFPYVLACSCILHTFADFCILLHTYISVSIVQQVCIYLCTIHNLRGHAFCMHVAAAAAAADAAAASYKREEGEGRGKHRECVFPYQFRAALPARRTKRKENTTPPPPPTCKSRVNGSLAAAPPCHTHTHATNYKKKEEKKEKRLH